MSYRLLIKGGYGLTNFGDDALMYVLASKLKAYFQKNEAAFACYENKYNEWFSNGYKIESVQNFKSIKTELLLFGGGTQFYSFLPKRSISRIILSDIKAFLLNPESIISKFLKNEKLIGYKSTAAMGVGVGPFLDEADPSAEKNAKDIFSQMSYVAVRDTYSFNKMKDWKVDNAEQYADICYLMDAAQYSTHKKTSIKSIGIVIRDWNLTADGKAYYDKIQSITEELEKKNYEVTLIIFAKKSDKFWSRRKKVFSNTLEWDPGHATIEEFMGELANFDLFLTARYHGAVFATLLNIPFISIEVEQKLALISQVYDGGSKKWGYPFDVEDCLNKVDQINQKYIEFVHEVHLTTINQQQKANDMFGAFIDYCKMNGILKSKSE